MSTPIPDDGSDARKESLSLEDSDPSGSRKKNLWVGIVCTLASVGIFGLVALHQWNPNHLYDAARPATSVRHGRIVHEMPTWMAAGAGGLFGLVGLTWLIPAILGIKLSKSAAGIISMSILIYFCGLVDFICLHSAFTGETFVDLPFLPQKLNEVLSWIIWGIFILFFSIFTAAGFVKMWTLFRTSSSHRDRNARAMKR